MEEKSNNFTLLDLVAKSDNTTAFLEGENRTIGVIDGDGFGYLIGYHFQHEYEMTEDLVKAVYQKVDDYISNILNQARVDHYIGILEAEVNYDLTEEEAAKTSVNFRVKYAETKPYKGKRPEKPVWYKIWGPIVQERLVTRWGFQRVPPNVEADDMVASLAGYIRGQKGVDVVIFGNDKDLHQIPCIYFDYRKNESWVITPQEANRKLYAQILEGDTTDNIPGLKGYGGKKAALVVNNEKFNEKSGYMYTLREFVNTLGEDKGIRSFFENYMLIKLRPTLNCAYYTVHKFSPEETREEKALRELLGWGGEEIKSEIPSEFKKGDTGLFSI